MGKGVSTNKQRGLAVSSELVYTISVHNKKRRLLNSTCSLIFLDIMQRSGIRLSRSRPCTTTRHQF